MTGIGPSTAGQDRRVGRRQRRAWARSDHHLDAGSLRRSVERDVARCQGHAPYKLVALRSVGGLDPGGVAINVAVRMAKRTGVLIGSMREAETQRPSIADVEGERDATRSFRGDIGRSLPV